MAWLNQYYHCSKGHEWQDEWDCLCDDRCPICDESCSPYDHAEIDLNSQDKAYQDAILHGKGVVKITPDNIESIPFIMMIRKGSKDEQSETLGNRNPFGNTDGHMHQSLDARSPDRESADD